MKRRTVGILAVIFVVLVALVALSRYTERRREVPVKAPVDLAAATEADTDAIVITSAGTSLTVTKVDGTWRIGTDSKAPTASPTQVKALFDGLKKARFERLVTNDPDDLEQYGLSKGAARAVLISTGDATLAAFTLGDPTDVPGQDYVQAAKSKAVWVVSGDLRALTDPSATLWEFKPEDSESPTATPSPTAPAGAE